MRHRHGLPHPLVISRPSYRSYNIHNGTNFRRSIQDPNSRLRKLLKFIVEYSDDYQFTKAGFFHWLNEPRAFTQERIPYDPMVRSQFRFRHGWGNSFWTACIHAEIIQPLHRRTSNGYMVYDVGGKFDVFLEMGKFFSRTDRETRYWYSPQLPKGWEVTPTVSHWIRHTRLDSLE